MSDCIFPIEVIRIIALKKLLAFVKLRECCTEFRYLLPLYSRKVIKFSLKPTLIYDFNIKRLISRPAIIYLIVSNYVIKVINISHNLMHIKIFTEGKKIVDLAPSMVMVKENTNKWKYPNTVELIKTPNSSVFKYYDRENDGLICRLILKINFQSNDIKYTIWYNNHYYVVEYNNKSNTSSEYMESSIPEYYPPRIEPDRVPNRE